MNTNIGLLALIQILSSLTTGIIILWLTFRILKAVGKRFLGIEAKTNLSFSIFTASILFSVGFSVSTVIQPVVSSFRLLSKTSDSLFDLTSSFILYGGIYVAIAYAASMIISCIGILIYTNMTPIDEFKEIKDNNVGVAILVGSIIITINLISRSGVALLIESLLPYPDLPPTGF